MGKFIPLMHIALGSEESAPASNYRRPIALMAAVPPALTSLLSAVEWASETGSEFVLLDIECVEAYWEMLEAFSTDHGFVLRLRDGRRVYLGLSAVHDDEADEPTDDLEVCWLDNGHRPKISGHAWIEDTGELNRFLNP